MDVAALLTAYGLVLVAELPDKSMLAVLLLSSRYSRLAVALGAAAAFSVHVVLAAAGGHLLGLLPTSVTGVVVTLVFAVAAVWMWRAQPEDARQARQEEEAVASRVGRRRSVVRVAAMTGLFVFLGEWGDITQVATVNLAARFDTVSVGVGALLALWTAVTLAVTVGGGVLRRLPPRALLRTAAVVFAVLAVVSAVSVLTR